MTADILFLKFKGNSVYKGQKTVSAAKRKNWYYKIKILIDANAPISAMNTLVEVSLFPDSNNECRCILFLRPVPHEME
jgi:hypothetical protein